MAKGYIPANKKNTLDGMTPRELLDLLNAEFAKCGLPLATLAEGEPEGANGEQKITAILQPLQRREPEDDNIT